MPTLTISNLDEVYVKVSAEDGILYELRDAFTFLVPGYMFMSAYKNKLWDGKIRLMNLRDKTIYRGLVPDIVKFCEDRDYSWAYDNEIYDDEFSLIEAKEFIEKLNIAIDPRDYQIDAFVHAMRVYRALLLSPTASGKSLIIYLIIMRLLSTGSKKGLIIVPTVQLVEQLTNDFTDYSAKNGWNVAKSVHKIYQGKDKNSNFPLTISTWQSIFKMPPEYFEQFDFIIGDEAHNFKAKSLMYIMSNLVNAKYRIGTTGTLDGTKTHKTVLEGLFGKTQVITTTDELMKQKFVSELNIKALLLKHSDSVCQLMKTATYQEEIDYIVGNVARNRFITNLALSLENNTLILFQFIEKHGVILHKMLTDKLQGTNRNCYFIYGKTDVEVRETIRLLIEKDNNAIILASVGTFSTGINIKNLHNVIFASPSKARIRALQSIGRVLRLSENKLSATLYDIADDLRYKSHENFTIKHFAERIKIYGQEKFKFKIYKINLKGT